jgi:hypothetical protein
MSGVFLKTAADFRGFRRYDFEGSVVAMFNGIASP